MRDRSFAAPVLLIVSHLVAVLIGYCVAQLLARPEPASEPLNWYVNRETFGAIQVGMTYTDVQELLGDAGEVIDSKVVDGAERKEVVWERGPAGTVGPRILIVFLNNVAIDKQARKLE